MFSISTYWLIAGPIISHLGRHGAKVALILGLSVGCRAPVALDWSTSLGEGGASAPLVAPGFIAVGTESALIILEHSGQRRCRVDFGGHVFTPRLAGPDRLLVTSGNNLVAVDTGCNVSWKRDIGDRAASAAAVGNDVAVVATVTGRLVAVAIADGTTRWTFSGPNQPASFIGPASVSVLDALGPGEVTIADNAVYVVDVRGELFALRLVDGQPLWSVRLADTAASTPVVANGRVIAGADDGGVHALDAATHALIWQLATDDRVRGAPLLENGVVYAGSDDRHLYAIDGDSGVLRWLAEVEGPVRSRPVGFRNLVFVAGGYGDGRLYALSRDDGGRFWHGNTDSGVIADLAVFEDTVYVTSVEGMIYAFRVLRTFDH